MNTLTDNVIMLKVKAGDLDMMSLLFERHSRALYGFLFHMTHQREASEDMVQNVFYRMLKYRHTYTGEGEFVTWMYHLARNGLKDQGKHQQKTWYHENIEDLADRVGGGILADEALQKKQANFELQRAINKLNEDQREILVLSRLQELKYHDIAKVLNITEGAVKVRVYRAMQELKSIGEKMNF